MCTHSERATTLPPLKKVTFTLIPDTSLECEKVEEKGGQGDGWAQRNKKGKMSQILKI